MMIAIDMTYIAMTIIKVALSILLIVVIVSISNDVHSMGQVRRKFMINSDDENDDTDCDE